ncbi:hypothetical protein ACXYMO_03215 [Arenibacterium sp. CAU 1754]
MTLITPEDRLSQTAELLRSLHATVRKVRQQAEILCQNMQAGEETDFSNCSRQVAAVDTLVRTCQKVEASLVEQRERQAGIAQGGFAIDLDQARSDIGCRLARLRTCKHPRDILE